jgi:hypothetical protein
MFRIILILVLGAWIVAGDPQKNIADALWADSSAPWEKVDGFYYMSKTDHGTFERKLGMKSSKECKEWVNTRAAAHKDEKFVKSEFECKVGMSEKTKKYRVVIK